MDRGWLKAWIVATLVVASLAIGYESFLRSHRYVPTVQDDADLWSIQYDRVKADPHAVVLLGASRIGFGGRCRRGVGVVAHDTRRGAGTSYSSGSRSRASISRSTKRTICAKGTGTRMRASRRPVMIDFRDEPAFAGFALPDTSHIDGVGVPRFTQALVEALARRGLVTRATAPSAPPPPM